MRRFACIGFALAALIALPAFGRAEAATTFPTRMQISGDEYWVTLSRLKVPTGKVKIEFVNYGEDPHDVKLRRFGRKTVYSIPKTESGERAIRTFKLIPGRYHVWCAITDHKQKGMYAVLRVKRR